MARISHPLIRSQTDWSQKTLGEKCVIKSRRRTKYIHNHPEEIKSADDIEPLIVFSFDMDNTIIYQAKTLNEKEEHLEKYNEYIKIHAPILSDLIYASLEPFIKSHIPILPILVTSSSLKRTENIIQKTESKDNILKDIFTLDQIFARGTFNAKDSFNDIKKQDVAYSDKFIKKLQERSLIARQDNIHIIHFGDDKADREFIQSLNAFSFVDSLLQDETKSFLKIKEEYICVNLEATLYHHKHTENLEEFLQALSNITEEDRQNVEANIAPIITQKIDAIHDNLKEKFEILKNNKRPSEETASSSAKKMKTDSV